MFALKVFIEFPLLSLFFVCSSFEICQSSFGAFYCFIRPVSSKLTGPGSDRVVHRGPGGAVPD